MNRRSFFRGLLALFAIPVAAKAASVRDGRAIVLKPRQPGLSTAALRWTPEDPTDIDAHIAIRQALIAEGVLPDYSTEEKAAFARHRQDHLRYLNQCQT